MPANQTSTFDAALNLIDSNQPVKPVSDVSIRSIREGQSPTGAPRSFSSAMAGPDLAVLGSIEEEKIREKEFIAKERQLGVPLDVNTGLPAGQRAKMSFERNPEKRAEWLSKQPGIESVRRTSSGDGIIVRVKDDQGNPRDILADERGFTMKDFADLAGDLPQITAAALLAYFTGGLGLTAQALTVGGGTAATGATQDIAVRKGSGRDVDLPEIAAARGIEAGLNTALPLIPAGGKRLAQVVIGPFGRSVGPLEIEAKQAAERLGVPLTASQLTGSKAVARVEQFTKELPLGGPLVEQAKAQDEAIRKVRNYLLGGEPETVPTSQEIAERTSGALAERRQGAETVAALKRREAEKTGEGEITRVLESELPVGSVTPSQAGNAVRSRVIALRDDFKKRVNEAYAKVYSLPGADEAFVPSAPVKTLVNDIRQSSTEATEALVPEIRRIFQVGETIPDNMTLKQATELRSVIGDTLGKPAALPGISESYKERLYGALSESINEGVKKAPNPEIGQALSEAQTLYKNEFHKFEQPGVKDLFSETAPGKGFQVGDTQVAQRIVSGKGNVDQLRVYKDLLGANSPEYQGLLRSAVTEMMDESRFGREFIDAGSFLNKLKGMSPEFRKEAIGPIEKELVDNAQLIELAQGKKIPELDFERILNARPGKVASVVRDVVEEQAAIDRYYSSSLMKQLTDGRFNPASFNADEFVGRFVDNASVKDLRQVMTQLRALDKELPDMVRRRSMLELLEKASADLTPEDKLTGEISRYSEDKLKSLLSGPSGEKYRTLLGAETMDTLQDLTTIEASREKARSMAKASGQLVYSNILAALMDFKLGEVPRIVKNRILAGALTTPGVRAWLTSQNKIPATPTIRKAVFASPPVIRSIIQEFKDEPDTLGQVLDAIKYSPSGEAPDGFSDAKSLIDSKASEKPRE